MYDHVPPLAALCGFEVWHQKKVNRVLRAFEDGSVEVEGDHLIVDIARRHVGLPPHWRKPGEGVLLRDDFVCGSLA